MGSILFLHEDNWWRPTAVKRLYDVVFQHHIYLLLNDIFLFERRGKGKLVNWFCLFRVYLVRENVTFTMIFWACGKTTRMRYQHMLKAAREEEPPPTSSSLKRSSTMLELIPLWIWSKTHIDLSRTAPCFPLPSQSNNVQYGFLLKTQWASETTGGGGWDWKLSIPLR